MILTTSMLTEKLKNISDPAGKIMRMKANGELFQLTRGIYETDKNTAGYCLAGAIYAPSYLSFDYALSRYDLIPEAVYTYTSATFEKKKAKTYENHFGRFTFRDVPSGAYPFDVLIKEENGYIYRIASPEKALCDKLYIMPPVTSQKDIARMLFEDLRIDPSDLDNLDTDRIIQLGGKYHSNNLKYFVKYLERRSV